MKKILLSLSALLIIAMPKVSAQLINADFETWHQNSLAPTGVKDPNTGNGTSGWWDFNFANAAALGSSPVTVFQDSVSPAPYHGSYCAKIISDSMASSAYNTLKGYGFPYKDTNGIIISAYANIIIFPPTFTFKPGVPFNQKISSYSFWYRYIPNGVDTCSCTVTLSHYSGGSSHAIGGGSWRNSATVGSWTLATVNITYDSLHSIPDTILIQYSACSLMSKPKLHDTMNIDDGSVTGLADISEQHDNVTLYPNPANSEINLAVTGQFEASHVEVYDITGKVVGTYSIHNNFLTINTQAFSSGVYIYKLLNDTGVQLNVGKFNVVK